MKALEAKLRPVLLGMVALNLNFCWVADFPLPLSFVGGAHWTPGQQIIEKPKQFTFAEPRQQVLSSNSLLSVSLLTLLGKAKDCDH